MTNPRDVSPEEIESRLRWVLVSVPSVVNGSIAAAQRTLQQEGLRRGRTETRENDGERTPGDVAAQSPRSGESVRRGSSVDLEVWGPVPVVVVPSVLSEPLEQAQAALQRQRLRPGAVSTRENDGRQTPGTIASQSPRAGESVPIRSRVNLEQWGPLPVNVPQVLRRTLGDARATLERAGLRVGSVGGASDPRDNDLVSGQSPAAGTSVPAGSRVDLTVSRPTIGLIPDRRTPRATTSTDTCTTEPSPVR